MRKKQRAPQPNREQRRAEEFGRPAAGPATGADALLDAADLTGDEAIAGRPDQDQTRQTGPGTGGATEYDGRIPRHEGTHATNSAKG